jgi:SAM-dependent methyltransferase
MSNNPNKQENLDIEVVKDFGKEWNKFNFKGNHHNQELKEIFSEYFAVFPFDKINSSSEGFDMGCGSGRWAKFVSPRVAKLNCIDPSLEALEVAKKNLEECSNVTFMNESVSSCTLKDESQDFGYSLGVLHHIPNTLEGIKSCAKLLKPGAPFLLYLYYRFDDRPNWFVFLWKISDILRKAISKLPFFIKKFLTDVIALFIYFPFARINLFLKKLNFDTHNFPLSTYQDKSFYQMRTDSLDRFGTKLEQRFTKLEIISMMQAAGFENIHFHTWPGWICVGYKKSN